MPDLRRVIVAVAVAIVASVCVGCCARPTVAAGPAGTGEVATFETDEDCEESAGRAGVRLQDHDQNGSAYVDPAGPEDGVGESGSSVIMADAPYAPIARDGVPRGVDDWGEASTSGLRESSASLEVLLAGVPLELMGGLDLGEVSLGYVDDSQAPYLQLDAELTGDRDPLTLLLPAERVEVVVAGDSSSARSDHVGPARALDQAEISHESAGASAPGTNLRRVTLRGDRGVLVPLDLPPQDQLRQVSATYYVFSVVVEMEHLDGRLDVLEVELDWDSWDIDASLEYRRLGPAWMGLFGRDTLSEEGPMEARLTKIEDVDGRRVWVGALESNPTTILRATP